MSKTKRKVRINWVGITWVILFVLTIVFFFIAIGFIAFPTKYTLPLGIVLALIDIIMGIFSLRRTPRYNKNGRRPSRRVGITIINCILSVLLAAGSIYIPVLESQMKGIFVAPKEMEEIKINAYVMTSAYKTEHPETFNSVTTSTDITDYKEAKFITQTKVDQDSQADAVNDIQSKLEVESLDSISTSGPVDAVSTLYKGEGDVMLLGEGYESTIKEVPGYENFSKDTQIIYTVVTQVEVEKKTIETPDYTNSSFMVYIAGSDSRDNTIEYYTRTDTDLLLTVDPVNKQIMLVSLPRDLYIPNPALNDENDKLTHLGNNGLQNTIDGLNKEFGMSYIKDYLEVNFITFYNIVEAIGGVDVYNPYTFTLTNGARSDDDVPIGEPYGYTYQEGTIHLSGAEAVSYVRERYNLPNGDFGRNEHESIVLQAVIKKLMSKDIITSYNSLLNNLQGNFLSSISSDDIYALAQMQLNDGGDWNFVNYHLSGTPGNDVTASTGNEILYVTYPLQSQIDFIREESAKIMNGEVITQGTLPDSDQDTVETN